MAESEIPRPRITATGKSGELFQYFALAGPEYSPGEVGWILILTGTEQEIPPQALSVKEVVDDLASMRTGDEAPLVVQMATEEMIAALERGEVAEPKHPGEPAASVRLARLRQELADAFPEG